MGRKLSAKGFTLIEVILVIVVTAIAIPALIYVLGQQARFTVDSEKVVNGALLGQELMEDIRSEGYGSTALYVGYTNTVTLGGVKYDLAAEVCEVDPTDLDTCTGVAVGYRRVRVTVTSDLGTTELVTVMTDL
jgi:prepilin-type N-terminal cleavage/methylation domain-containing protein